jgi:beta-lactamase superfamily II metal-dependent hydrolase
MAGKIRVRIYNILLGDAILVTLPSEPEQHILIDFGQKAAGEGANKSLFKPILDNILVVLDGAPLDLYVATHEHMDHVQGLLYASEHIEIDIKKALAPKYVWLTGSAHPTYYDTHENAHKQKKQSLSAFDQAQRFYAKPGNTASPFIQTLLDLNDSAYTDPCVDYLRKLSKKTYYIDRTTKLIGKHGLKDATIKVWAPEEDTSVYYGRFQALALAGGDGTPAAFAASLVPPSGVDAGAFYNLVQMRNNVGDTLLQIDAAKNNTSIVFCLEYGGKKLLFCGDAEERSWKQMNALGLLEPVDFLKIAHHGSHNGTPGVDLLDQVLPLDGKKRKAAVSTCKGAYSGMPDRKTLDELAERAEVYSTWTTKKDYPAAGGCDPGEWIDVMV